MEELSFDVEHPPEEPPPGVVQAMLWRIAVRVHRDHDRVVRGGAGALTCDLCRQPWPCPARRMAQRALVAAWRPPTDPPGAAGYLDRVLGTDLGPPAGT